MSQLCLLKAGSSGQGIAATQDWKFAANKSLTSSQGITPSFTRASGGSYFDASGVLQWNGLNLCLQSVVNNTTWSAFNETCTPNAALAPDGTMTAALIAENSVSSSHYHRQTISLSAGTYTASVYVKAKERTKFSFGGIATGRYFFDLTLGTATGVDYGSPASATITPVGNGWFRISVVGSAYAGGSGEHIQLILRDALGSANYLGDGVSGMYFWGAQLELGTSATTYSPTTTAANSAPRFDHVYNPSTNLWESRGLLIEEQRTNLCLQSSVNNNTWSSAAATLTPSAITAPDGTSSGALLVGNAGTANHFHRQVATIGAGTYTVSVYAKAKEIYIVALGSVATGSKFFNLQSGTVGGNAGGSPASASITPVGNGWYRLTVTGPAYAGGTGDQIQLINTNNTETVFHNADGTSGAYFWGAQIELGAFPTSYIPTTSASATRSADVCQVTGTSFSSFWNASEGSFAVEADRLHANTSAVEFIYCANDGTVGEQIGQYIESGTERNVVVDGGATQSILQATQYGSNIQFRASSRYKASDFACSYNGGVSLTDVAGTLPTATQLDIGNRISALFHNGHISRLRYFNKRLTDKQLEDLGKPELSKSLDLQFASTKSLTPLVGPTPTFTRASAGTYFDANGVLKYAPLNLILNSEAAGSWTLTNLSVSSNVAVAPDGKTTADLVIPSAGNAGHFARPGAPSITAGSQNVFSVYLKAGGYGFSTIKMYGGGGTFPGAQIDVNLSDGSFATSATGGGSSVSGSVASVGNGWWRVAISCICGSEVTARCDVYPSPSLGTISYAGDTVSGVYMWGAQFESGSVANEYTPTTSAANSNPRFDHTYDGSAWVSRGLLIEEQRTNLYLRSQEIDNASWTKFAAAVVANSASAPDGTVSADSLYEDASSSWHYAYQGPFTVSANTDYTLSFFVKKGTRRYVAIGDSFNAGNGSIVQFDLDTGSVVYSFANGTSSITRSSISSVGGGWFRIQVTIKTTIASFYPYIANTSTLLSSGNIQGNPYVGTAFDFTYVWGAQFELGSFASSYIPTASASVTRSADVCQITGTNFSGMWNASEFSMIADADCSAVGGSYGLAMADANGSQSWSGLYVFSSAAYVFTDVAGVIQAQINPGVISTGVTFGLAGGFRANNFAGSLNGSAASTDLTGSLPTVDRLRIGSRQDGSYVNGHIGSLQVYTIRLPNRLLVQKSS